MIYFNLNAETIKKTVNLNFTITKDITSAVLDGGNEITLNSTYNEKKYAEMLLCYRWLFC